jgi:peptide/nickel transport system substrate-binding protein
MCAVAVAAVLAVSGCGGSSSPSGTSSAGGTGAPSGGIKPALNGSGESLSVGKRGGTLTVDDHSDFQHLDPGEAYYAGDYEVIYATQRPLFSFPPNSSTSEVPNLASGPPVISDGGRTVTVHIEPNVKFSPPVNRTVTSQDVAYAIERGANPHVANPYFPSYFYYVVGASKANGGPIPGISTPNATTIVFHLTGPYATFFEGALTLPLTAPVPRSFAAPLDAKTPTQYGLCCEVATGPYMLKTDGKADAKFIGIGYQPGKSATLVRNPNWSPSTYAPNGLAPPPPAYLDQININIGGDPNVIGRQVLTGSHVLQNDPPAGPIVKLAYQHYYRQLVAVPGAGIFWVGLDNRSGPFANVNVRKAFWAALDRESFVKAAGGQIVGQVATHFIYPGSDGFDEAGANAGPAGMDYNASPTGNLTVATKYMKLAGYTSGKYTGSATVKIVGSTGDPNADWGAIANNAAQEIGFKTNFTLVDQPVMFGRYCGDPKAAIDICPDVGWIRDWADPQTLLDPTFAGYNIVSTNNSNWSMTSWQDWPKANGGTYTRGPLTPLDHAIKRAEITVGANARAAAWANIDRMLVADAVAVPTVWSINPSIESKDVNGINDLWNIGAWDYEYTSLR